MGVAIHAPPLALITILPVLFDVSQRLFDLLHRGLVACILAGVVTASYYQPTV